MITANDEELRRAVDNLVANAVRHARTRVELAADLDQDEVVLSVSDDGPGCPGGPGAGVRAIHPAGRRASP